MKRVILGFVLSLLLFSINNAQECSYRGRTNESAAEGRVFENTGQYVVEQYEASERRHGSGNTKDEEGAWKRHGDFWKRQHCFAIGPGGPDR